MPDNAERTTVFGCCLPAPVRPDWTQSSPSNWSKTSPSVSVRKAHVETVRHLQPIELASRSVMPILVLFEIFSPTDQPGAISTARARCGLAGLISAGEQAMWFTFVPLTRANSGIRAGSQATIARKISTSATLGFAAVQIWPRRT